MSTCISRHGEFGSHTLDDSYTCTLCHVLDEDALRAELERLRRALVALENDNKVVHSWVRTHRQRKDLVLRELVYVSGEGWPKEALELATLIREHLALPGCPECPPGCRFCTVDQESCGCDEHLTEVSDAH